MVHVTQKAINNDGVFFGFVRFLSKENKKEKVFGNDVVMCELLNVIIRKGISESLNYL